jgi:hypothetical protein
VFRLICLVSAQSETSILKAMISVCCITSFCKFFFNHYPTLLLAHARTRAHAQKHTRARARDMPRLLSFTHTFFIESCRSFNNGQTPPPKLVVTTCSNNESGRADRKCLVDTLISSSQMVSGSDCPVWFIDSESLEDDDAQSSIFDHQHPNYLVVKFFDADHFEKSLKNLPPTEFEKPNNRAVLGNIRDQVCTMLSPIFTSFTALSS